MPCNIEWQELTIQSSWQTIRNISNNPEKENPKKRWSPDAKRAILAHLILIKIARKKIAEILEFRNNFTENKIPNPFGGGVYDLNKTSCPDLLKLEEQTKYLLENEKDLNKTTAELVLDKIQKKIKEKIFVCVFYYLIKRIKNENN